MFSFFSLNFWCWSRGQPGGERTLLKFSCIARDRERGYWNCYNFLFVCCVAKEGGYWSRRGVCSIPLCVLCNVLLEIKSLLQWVKEVVREGTFYFRSHAEL